MGRPLEQRKPEDLPLLSFKSRDLNNSMLSGKKPRMGLKKQSILLYFTLLANSK